MKSRRCKKTDSSLTELRQEAKSISEAIGVALNKPEQASAIQQRVENWLVRAQQKIPAVTAVTQPGRAKLQTQVTRLKGEVQTWVERAAPQADKFQQDLSAWAGQVIKSGGQISEQLLNEGSELTSLWIQQTGLGAFYAWLNNTPTPIITAKAMTEFEQISTPFCPLPALGSRPIERCSNGPALFVPGRPRDPPAATRRHDARQHQTTAHALA